MFSLCPRGFSLGAATGQRHMGDMGKFTLGGTMSLNGCFPVCAGPAISWCRSLI